MSTIEADRSRRGGARATRTWSCCTPAAPIRRTIAELNLRAIPTLRERYGVPVGYSGHETGIAVDRRRRGARAPAASSVTSRWIASMWGTDQAASLEPNGISRVVQRHPPRGAVDGRWREARLRTRAADHQEAAPRRRRQRHDELKAIALDVDGVLTDGGVWWGPDGEEWKRFSFADIMGVSLARKAGLIVALISGEDSPLVDRFAPRWESPTSRRTARTRPRAARVRRAQRPRPYEICFMGDDVNDLGAMEMAGLAAAPANARAAALRQGRLRRPSGCGGNGAVRELVDAMLASDRSRRRVNSWQSFPTTSSASSRNKASSTCSS